VGPVWPVGRVTLLEDLPDPDGAAPFPAGRTHTQEAGKRGEGQSGA
jgi:hypothetical protein